MQTQLRAPVSDARHLTVCRQGPGAPSQRLSLALPRTASRHASSLSRADEHALYAERLPGTTNFAAVSTSRLTVLCGHGLAHPNEVRRRPVARQRFAVPPSTCSATSRGLACFFALQICHLCLCAMAEQLRAPAPFPDCSGPPPERCIARPLRPRNAHEHENTLLAPPPSAPRFCSLTRPCPLRRSSDETSCRSG